MAESGNPELVVVYFIGTLGMILLAAVIVFFFVAYQKRLLTKQLELNRIKSAQQDEIIRNTIAAQEKERKRIAQDLHDEVGAMLSVVKLNIGRIEKKSENDTAKNLAGETKSYVDDLIAQVRRISRSLLPPSLEKLGIYYAVVEFADWINKAGQIKVHTWKSGGQFRFDDKQELAIFRIVQEIINNSIKHSEATKMTVNMKFSTKMVLVSLSDNGKGFNLGEKRNTGLGLKNLESRSQMIGAKFKIKSTPGMGTSAIICLNTKR